MPDKDRKQLDDPEADANIVLDDEMGESGVGRIGNAPRPKSEKSLADTVGQNRTGAVERDAAGNFDETEELENERAQRDSQKDLAREAKKTRP